jgi:metallo-beta-lactamase class B
VQIAGLAVLLALSLFQAPTFKSDPPHKCDDCDEWNKPREPFKVFGNTYFVGTDGLSAILIVGDAGLILLDGGLEQSAAVIDANIRKLGFKTRDVTLIVNSHGHYDHAGGIAASSGQRRDRRGEPVGRRCAAARREHHRRSAVRIRQGVQRLSTGEERQGDQGQRESARRQHRDHRELHARPHAGQHHVDWQSCEGTQCLNIVYADSISAVSAPRIQVHRSPDVVTQFRRSISRLGELPCDIVVSTHPSATNLDDKIKKRAAEGAVPIRSSITAARRWPQPR